MLGSSSTTKIRLPEASGSSWFLGVMSSVISRIVSRSWWPGWGHARDPTLEEPESFLGPARAGSRSDRSRIPLLGTSQVGRGRCRSTSSGGGKVAEMNESWHEGPENAHPYEDAD